MAVSDLRRARWRTPDKFSLAALLPDEFAVRLISCWTGAPFLLPVVFWRAIGTELFSRR